MASVSLSSKEPKDRACVMSPLFGEKFPNPWRCSSLVQLASYSSVEAAKPFVLPQLALALVC